MPQPPYSAAGKPQNNIKQIKFSQLPRQIAPYIAGIIRHKNAITKSVYCRTILPLYELYANKTVFCALCRTYSLLICIYHTHGYQSRLFITLKSRSACAPIFMILTILMEFTPPCLGLNVMGIYLVRHPFFLNMTETTTFVRK